MTQLHPRFEETENIFVDLEWAGEVREPWKSGINSQKAAFQDS